jgi:hypothetical protein
MVIDFLINKIFILLKIIDSDAKDNEITFKKLYEETEKNLNPEMKSSVNDSSLFVCMLHLANEKSILKYYQLFLILDLDLIQIENNERDFKIKFN